MSVAHDRRVLEALLRNDFLTFAQRVFRELNPGRTFQLGWHHQAIAYLLHVTAITSENDRLIINLPSRSAKSTIVSVALPAFCLAVIPQKDSLWSVTTRNWLPTSAGRPGQCCPNSQSSVATVTAIPSSASVTGIWHDRRLLGWRSSELSSKSSSSALIGGNLSSHCSAT